MTALFDPTKITTFIPLAAAAIWAMCYMRNAKRITQWLMLIGTLAALSLAACLERSYHADPCAKSAKILINEFCAEGKQCDGGKDFVEIINPTARPVDLGCYALADRRSTRSKEKMPGNPFLLPRGQTLGPGEVRAWDAGETRFQLSWKRGDRLQLGRVDLSPGRPWDLEPLDDVMIDSNRSYGWRTGDKAVPWNYRNHETAAKEIGLGTFGRPNGKLP